MTLRIAADGVLVLHFAFILFVIGGAGLAFRFPRIVWLHLPAACWGAWVEIAARVCPLTTLENALRVRAGQQGYTDSFVEHYLLPVIYPPGLTQSVQFALAAFVILVNAALYGWLLRRRRKTRIK
jgi:hypothetical protein